MPHDEFNLAAAAREEMLDRGFEPDFSPEAMHQLATFTAQPTDGLQDLTALLWSSIDNDESRDLDQVEWAEQTSGGIRVLVGVADVDSLVAKGTPLDLHAQHETTSVYTGVRVFPMLPERLSTDLTSLNEHQDRAAVITEFVVAADGSILNERVYRAKVRNSAQLTYNAVGAWLEATAPAPPKVAASPELQAQLKLQDQAAQALRQARSRLGALDFNRQENKATLTDGVVTVEMRKQNRAAHLIEDFMIGANEVMARTLRAAKVSSIRRIVRSPERWARIVELAARYGEKLPAEPDSGALNTVLMHRKAADPVHYPDVSLAILKLMGPGEYVLMRPNDEELGHFGLAAHDYTHSTAPNRRFADLVTQRLLKALGGPAPYTDAELDAIAHNCTGKEDDARKVERNMNKRLAAASLIHRIGQNFSAVVTGATPKGVFVRVLDPAVEGRLMRGEDGLDVGDRLRVTLLSADPRRGFIDFGRIG